MIQKLLLYICFITNIVFFNSFSTLAQGRTNSSGTGGIHTIQGRVFLPNGRNPELPITVKLQSNNFSTISVTTDQSGTFVFRSLAPGNYSVVIEGLENMEIVKEYITIDTEAQVPVSRNTMPKIINIPIYLQNKRNSETLTSPEVIDARLANVPKQALKHYEQANTLEKSNQYGSAILEYQKAVVIYPQFTQAYNKIGKIFLILGKLDNAISAFLSAIKNEPKNFEATLGYGISLLNKKDLEESEKALIKSIELNKNAVTPHYYLGLVFIQKNKIDEAIKEMETAKKMKGRNDLPQVHYYLGGLYWNNKQYKMAADELEIYLESSSKVVDAVKLKKTISELRSKQ